MNNYEEALKIIEERFGNNKDNPISLATISIDAGRDDLAIPCVRDVDAYYDKGKFYVVTYALSNKMKQIANNANVGIAVHFGQFSANGIGTNLGWVMEPKNSDLRTKLREVFAEWYDSANNENDVNCCILEIALTKATIMAGHGEGVKFINMDFINKTAV